MYLSLTEYSADLEHQKKRLSLNLLIMGHHAVVESTKKTNYTHVYACYHFSSVILLNGQVDHCQIWQFSMLLIYQTLKDPLVVNSYA